MRILVLDDSLSRVQNFRIWLATDELVVAASASEALAFLRTQRFDLVFLDHDLGYNAPTGSVLTRQWRQQKGDLATQAATVVVHTSSEAGASLMTTDLKQIGTRVIRKPYYTLSASVVGTIVEQVRQDISTE